MRKILGHHTANYMIKIYSEVKEITDNGGVAYETKSAIWAFEPFRERVTLFVKNPSPMTNDVLDYTKDSKNYETHKNRIIKLTGAKPTSYTARDDFENMIRRWSK